MHRKAAPSSRRRSGPVLLSFSPNPNPNTIVDLRNFPKGMSAHERCNERRTIIEHELHTDLSALSIDPTKLGNAEEKNCEQMFGHLPLPVGLAGPLPVTLDTGEKTVVHLPLATTEGALVASVNRGCKALSLSGGVRTSSKQIGVTRSIAFRSSKLKAQSSKLHAWIAQSSAKWCSIGETTSKHLKILSYEIDIQKPYLFLTIACDTSEAMGMNMVTIAAQAIGEWIAEKFNLELVTVAGNVDSDKKPSQRTHDRGRGFLVTAEADVPSSVIASVFRTTPEKLLGVADAKLKVGSKLAGAIGSNLHAANIIAALYLATGQDPAHVVEGSLADTTLSSVILERTKNQKLTTNNQQLRISVRLPALLVGIRGGGTELPAQSQCLNLLIGNEKRSTQRLAQIISAAVLAGELSLLAAQATQTLVSSHRKLAR
ncbi:MAG: 3-hydroxy-3-methylglutaryl-CoA reductase [Candidatus Peregrinibacteria bacterium]